jgi:hypothetical protein
MGGKEDREPLGRDIIAGIEGARSCPFVSGGGQSHWQAPTVGEVLSRKRDGTARLVAFNFAFAFAVAVLLTQSIGCPLRARRGYQCHQRLR